MSSGFKNREKGFETKFSRDEAFEFKVTARRNKLLGLWIAEKMGLNSQASTEYAMTVVQSDFEEAGHEDVIRKVMGDIKEKNLDVSEDQLRTEMERLAGVARTQLDEEAIL